MRQPDDAFLRTYALEMLADVNDQPYINKEKLFADTMAFYRWRLSQDEAEDALALYMHEFRVHHRQVVHRLDKEVWSACFITWFIEQGFHRLPPLTGFDPEDEDMRGTRFSSPSFRLPTGEPTETYLVQWVLWHLDNPPRDGHLDGGQVLRWARGLADDQALRKRRERLVLIEKAIRFFSWCRLSVHTWTRFMEYVMDFLYSEPERIETLLNHPRWDTCFVNWFVDHNIDHAQPPAGNV